MACLKDVSSSPGQSQGRRAEAAFEHAIASVALRITNSPNAEELIDEALEMLRFAAACSSKMLLISAIRLHL
jgi:hypothetical protein